MTAALNAGAGTSPGDATSTNPVVSTLPNKSPHPYSSVTLSPDRTHAVVAARDVLRVVSISPSGLSEQRSVRVSQYFAGQAQAQAQAQAKAAQQAAAANAATHGDVRDAFVSPTAAAAAAAKAAASTSFAAAGAGANVTINDVAWSLPQSNNGGGQYYGSSAAGGGGADNNGGVSGAGSGPGGAAEDTNAAAVADDGANPSTAADTATVSSGDPFDNRSYSSHKAQHPPTNEDTLVAAAGSNGVVVVWKAETALLGKGGGGSDNKGFGSHQAKTHLPFHHRGDASPASAATIGQPEAILAEHTRAVNRVAFHPTGRRPGLLLTASQDATVKLWERRATTSVGSQTSQKQQKEKQKKKKKSWFAMSSSSGQESAAPVRSYSWRCIATFQPKAEAVRDIAWHPNNDDVFAMVTDNGTLLVYDIRVTVRPWVRFSVHAGEATTVDWHPTRKYYLATGGGRDRSVKIWDLENGLSLSKSEDNVATNSSSDTGGLAEDIAQPNSGSASGRFVTLADSTATTRSIGSMGSNVSSLTWGPSMKRSFSTGPLRPKSSPIVKKHTLAVSAPVTRLEWRPEQSARRKSVMSEADYGAVDRHDAMVAVTTAPISGASAGGSGSISLWSWHRSFMPLSIVEGHKDGAVTDFVWLDTPPPTKDTTKAEDDALIGREVVEKMSLSSPPRASKHVDRLSVSLHNIRHPIFPEASEQDNTVDHWIDLSTAGTWQHVLSVGRDGNCLLQSLARGERPISRVPPSTFAIANLSPFQSGFGSLQIMSLHQDVPSGAQNDYKLTGLRRDEGTASAPGVFHEDALASSSKEVSKKWDPKPGGQREPRQTPELLFSVTDQGDLDEFGAPLDHSQNVAVAPEVQHLSRFADAYRFHTDADYPSKVDLCVHNSMVADGLQFDSLAHMWRMLASILKGACVENLSQVGHSPLPTNPMAFILLPTIHKLLLERADAGDVQSCVAICEVMGVVAPPSASGQQPKIIIPNLSIELVREWYLSYIDLLQQMCLFSHAAALIGTCADPVVGALNQQSTTIHESCPKCGKPLDSTVASDAKSDDIKVGLSTQRVCKRCREQVGLCFLCHEVVKGMYVWCPGCGHGGHLQHALEWFGGTENQSPQELCPVGCGHRCNLLQRLKAFPEDAQAAMMCVPVSGGE